MKENVNHPSHYNHGGKETIEIIKDFLMGDSLTGSEFKGFLKGNILKYLHRYEFKNGVEDLCKAQWYLNELKELEEKNGVENPCKAQWYLNELKKLEEKNGEI